ncbi:MAG: hypothetical protein H6670_02525 [Anaerolineaceae bacterium]|nr:hypothetical protein [Anaerolineaceae bacterium]
MQLQEVMNKFIALEYANTSDSIEYPDAEYSHPSILKNALAHLWTRYPSLKADESFVEFLETYGEALVIPPPISASGTINSLWSYTSYLLYEEEDAVYHGFIIFCDVTVGDSDGPDEKITYAFKLSDMPSVYRHQNDENTMDLYVSGAALPFERYCGTFIEWLERLVQAKGKLTD